MLHLKKGQIQFRSFYDLGVGLRLTFLKTFEKRSIYEVARYFELCITNHKLRSVTRTPDRLFIDIKEMKLE